MKKISAQIQGREEIHLDFELDNDGCVSKFQLSGVGDDRFLSELVKTRGILKNAKLNEIPLPAGNSPAEILIREVLSKAQGKWKYPITSDELCHCRGVSTQIVDSAICAGAVTPEMVSRETSASTACGTCRGDVEALIALRLQKNNENTP